MNIELQELLSESPSYACYTSPEIQNEIIDTIKKYIVEKVIDRVKKRRLLFRILMDETTDCG